MASFGWVFGHQYSGISLDSYPHLQAWKDRIFARPGVKEGINVPEKPPFLAALEDEGAMKRMVQDGRSMMISAEQSVSVTT